MTTHPAQIGNEDRVVFHKDFGNRHYSCGSSPQEDPNTPPSHITPHQHTKPETEFRKPRAMAPKPVLEDPPRDRGTEPCEEIHARTWIPMRSGAQEPDGRVSGSASGGPNQTTMSQYKAGSPSGGGELYPSAALVQLAHQRLRIAAER
jgi:hypothetical protein